MSRLLLITSSVILLFSQVTFSQIGVNIYGISYHLDRIDIDGNSFNEINPGTGLNYLLLDSQKHILFIEGGIYKDSFENIARYIGTGYKYKFTKNISFGIGLFYLKTLTINHNNPVLAPLPLLSYRFKFVTLSMTYFPEYKNINDYPTIGVYSTFYILGVD